MKTKAMLFLGRLLIVFSVFLIILGTCITFFGDEKLLHPIYDVIVISGNENDGISITTVSSDEDVLVPEENHVVSSSNDSSNISEGTTETVISGGTATEDIEPSNDVVSSFIDDTESVVIQPNAETVSDLVRTQIQEKFGVTVKYANETSGYGVGGMSTTVISDPVVSQNALISLNSVLSLYPDGFFEEIKNKGYPLTFYLVKRYSTDNVTGVTDCSDKSVVISIATDYDFVDTFHHEVYHYLERYILSAGGTFTSWNSLNPAGFKYGVIDSNYSYSTAFSSDAFFVNSYAMTDQYEDRASTFEYMMKANKASCLNYGKTIWLKAKTMSEQIDYFFNTVTPTVTEHWERHLS